MRQAQQIRLFKLFRDSNIQEETAEEMVKILADDSQTIEDLKKIFLTKDDKVDLISRMDSHFKWLLGIIIGAMFTLFSIAIALFKLL